MYQAYKKKRVSHFSSEIDLKNSFFFWYLCIEFPFYAEEKQGVHIFSES